MISSHYQNQPLQILGLMSGTSLDGVDLAACTFIETDNGWQFKLDAATTIPYSDEWKNKLKNAPFTSGEELTQLHAELGKYFAKLINDFNDQHLIKPSFIGSHGHTIFHQPSKNFTLQIADGAQIAALTGIDTICDFRNKDIALGGQGAPLVPIGDRLLFSEYAACINLGGIANVSYEKNGKRIGFDICPVNMLLNYFANRIDKPYDDEGNIARSGTIIPDLLEKLNNLNYYKQSGPKSLGKEWFDKEVLPLVEDRNETTADLLRTSVEHIAMQHRLIKTITSVNEKILLSGGGVFNTFLVERMTSISDRLLEKPSVDIIQYKEAIVFAFLAMLFVNNHDNVLCSATGSSKNHCGGAYHRGN